MARFGPASIGIPKYSGRSASSWTPPTCAPQHVPCLQRRITNLKSDQALIAGSALHLHPHPHRPPTYHARLPLSGLSSGQTPVRGLPLLLLGQSAAVHLPPPVVSAQVRLPVQLLARQPRLKILAHHLIRRTPFRPPAYIHRGPPQLAITACACPQHTCSTDRFLSFWAYHAVESCSLALNARLFAQTITDPRMGDLVSGNCECS